MEVKFLTRKNIENVIPDAKNLEKIVLPSQIKTIGAGTFSNYKNLKEINLNNGLIEIGQRAFANLNIETIPFSYDELSSNKILGSSTKPLSLSTCFLRLFISSE